MIETAVAGNEHLYSSYQSYYKNEPPSALLSVYWMDVSECSISHPGNVNLREEGREGATKEGREGRSKEAREGARKGEREGGREGEDEMNMPSYSSTTSPLSR